MLHADALSVLFVTLSTGLWFVTTLYAIGYLEGTPHRNRFFGFFGFFSLCVSATIGIAMVGNMLTFLFFYELLTLSTYPLVVHRGTPEALRGGRIYLIYTLIGGAVLLFAGMIIAAQTTDELSFSALQPVLAQSESRDLILGLLLLGFGIKAGLIGLHVWLPLAHPVAPTPACAVLSGAMVKAGLLGWLRMLPFGEAALPHWGETFIMIGVATTFYGALIGLTQTNPKTVLAYSSISQMGIVTIGIGLGLSTPAAWPTILAALLIYALHHSLTKGALFLGVGMAGKPITGPIQLILVRIGLLLPALALAGAPLTSGMLAKISLKSQLLSATHPLGFLAAKSAALEHCCNRPHHGPLSLSDLATYL